MIIKLKRRKRLTKFIYGILSLFMFFGFSCSLNKSVDSKVTESNSSRSINSNSPNYPFPMGLNHSGAIKPSNRTQAQLNQDVLDYFNYWESKYVKTSNGNTPGGGYYIKAVSTGGHAYPIKSNSEAHGYGMIIYALMGDKEHYDGMFNMYDKHRSTMNPDNMSWVITEEEYPSQDGNSATDGDFDVAYSMLLAHKQWGSDGNINYLANAKRMITNGIKASDMGSYSYRTLLGDWDTDQNSTRSSDWMAGHMRVFKEVTGDSFWNSAANTVYSLINSITTNYSPNTGLMPDFIVESNAKPAPPYFLEFQHDGSYYYNACRYPWRIAMDYVHFGTADSKNALDRLNSWLKTKTSNNPANIGAGYELNGTAISGSNYFTGAFAGPFIAGMVVNSANQDYLNAGWELLRNNKETYYEDNVTLLCMLLISGNWWNPIETSSDTEPPTQPGKPGAANIKYNSVDLSWTASTDNIGVTSYKIYSGSSLVKSVSGNITSTTINGLSPETNYSFTVKAFDLAGNSSPASNNTTVTTPAYVGQEFTITATAGSNGSISPNGSLTAIEGQTIIFDITPDQGYKIGNVLLDGSPVANTNIVNNKYSLENITSNHTVSVSFVEKASSELSVEYVIASDWSGNSFQADVIITNNSNRTVEGWKVTWDYQTQQINSSWSCNLNQTGQTVTITPAGWNGTIPPGGSVTLGFLGSYSGTNGIPANIVVE